MVVGGYGGGYVAWVEDGISQNNMVGFWVCEWLYSGFSSDLGGASVFLVVVMTVDVGVLIMFIVFVS